MEKKFKTPVIAWLKVTDYLHGWLQSELAGQAMVKEQHVICVLHLAGVKELLKTETAADASANTSDVCYAMSATRHNCIEAGLRLDPEEIKNVFGITREQMQLYVPIECPPMYMNANGVLRPWTLDIGFSRDQANALLRILRQEFWQAVGRFDKEYAAKHRGTRYTAKEMIEAFCVATRTSDVYLDAMRREWQRRQKRTQTATHACSRPQTQPPV